MTNRPLKWLVGVLVLVVLIALGVWAFTMGRKEIAAEREREAPIKAPARISYTESGEMVLTLNRQTQEQVGLHFAPLVATSLQRQVVAYGTIQEDPSLTFVLHSPIAGTLRAPEGGKWPNLGQELLPGEAVGAVEPRYAPTELVTLSSQLATARADVIATTASLAASKSAFDRLNTLNSEEAQSVSGRNLQDAEAKMKGEEARFGAATQTVKLIESALTAKANPSGSQPLTIPRGGQVVQLPASPGESVESGQAVLGVARYERLLASVSVLPGREIDPDASTGRFVVVGQEEHPLVGKRIAIAPSVDAKTLGRAYLFGIENPQLTLRPGMAVTGYLRKTGVPEPGVLIPRSAVVRIAGRTWIYVKVAEDKFTRREASVDEPDENGFFQRAGVKGGEIVVVAGAQLLVSEEFKSQIQVESEGGGN